MKSFAVFFFPLIDRKTLIDHKQMNDMRRFTVRWTPLAVVWRITGQGEEARRGKGSIEKSRNIS